MDQVAPALRLACDAIRRIAFGDDPAEFLQFLLPFRRGPVLAVEMTAAMARDLMPLEMGAPDIVEPLGDLLLGEGEADIGAAGRHVRRLVAGAVGALEQEDAGEEIGKARPGLLSESAAALPQMISVRSVKGNQHILRR
ncbi:hypothetical protein PPNSA23_11580 [Phyllobacterium phragmitis]|uniref:Uncharacterized protein n=1 Tax=Phyllobacterium phragmitis TaxID=2670329 RepID=A0ABQ0GX34_9HYPH